MPVSQLNRLIRGTMSPDDPRGILWVGGYTTGFRRGVSSGVILGCLTYMVSYAVLLAVL